MPVNRRHHALCSVRKNLLMDLLVERHLRDVQCSGIGCSSDVAESPDDRKGRVGIEGAQRLIGIRNEDSGQHTHRLGFAPDGTADQIPGGSRKLRIEIERHAHKNEHKVMQYFALKGIRMLERTQQRGLCRTDRLVDVCCHRIFLDRLHLVGQPAENGASLDRR